jgi:hypothetical protein
MTTARKIRPGDYFRQYRPNNRTLHAKSSRAQEIAREKPVTLPEVLFLRLTGSELFTALAARGHLRFPSTIRSRHEARAPHPEELAPRPRSRLAAGLARHRARTAAAATGAHTDPNRI